MSGKQPPLPLELNLEMLVQSSGESRKSFQLIGARAGHYLIIKPTKVTAQTLRPPKKGTELVVRYIYHGLVFAFRSKVLDRSSEPDQLIFITYPAKYDELSVRKAPRVSCLLPAEFVIGKQRLPGTIVDISYTGCSWRSSNLTYELGDKLLTEGALSLSITFPGRIEAVGVKCNEKYAKQKSELMKLGLAFGNVDEQTKQVVDGFINLGFISETLLEKQGK
jgi:c-di-GMP-binding flagellar brake protein YcgR